MNDDDREKIIGMIQEMLDEDDDGRRTYLADEVLEIDPDNAIAKYVKWQSMDDEESVRDMTLLREAIDSLRPRIEALDESDEDEAAVRSCYVSMLSDLASFSYIAGDRDKAFDAAREFMKLDRDCDIAGRVVYYAVLIERSDFEENPPPKFHRLKPGGEVRLMGTYFIKYQDAVRDENGNITEIHCSYDPDTFGGSSPDGRKVKGTIHWVSAKFGVETDVRLYERLFTIENTNDIPDGKTYGDYLNRNSVTVKKAVAEPDLACASLSDRYQFVRNGYFAKDSKIENTFNLIVGLKDGYNK
jgi:hypothetical protein